MNLEGKIISIEGIDAVGKTTQTGLLLDYILNEQNITKVKVYSFPDYTTETGKIIYDYLHNPKHDYRTKMFTNDYGETITGKRVFEIMQKNNKMEKLPGIVQELKSNYTLIMNRYIESQYVYGTLEGFDIHWLKQINSQLPKSDIVFVLALPIHKIKERLKRRKNKDIYEKNLKFLQKAQDRYFELAQEFDNWIIIGCDGKSSEQIHNDMITRMYLILR